MVSPLNTISIIKLVQKETPAETDLLKTATAYRMIYSLFILTVSSINRPACLRICSLWSLKAALCYNTNKIKNPEPLPYQGIREPLLRHRGFEPRTTWLKVKCSTNWANIPYFFSLKMPRTGIEPVTRGFSVLCSTDWAIWAKSSGDRIWTYDLRVMSPTSFQTAPPRVIQLLYHMLPEIYIFLKTNGWRWIRTTEAICSRFTVCPLWPLGNPSIWKFNFIKADDRTRTDNLLITNQLLCQLSHIGIILKK